jgi:hypothetical protein
MITILFDMMCISSCCILLYTCRPIPTGPMVDEDYGFDADQLF